MRELKSADEIAAEIDRVLHLVQEVIDDRVRFRIPPVRLREEAADGDCNWTVAEPIATPPRYEAAASHAIQRVARRWNLKS